MKKPINRGALPELPALLSLDTMLSLIGML